jgi:hypothetical protein
MPTFVAEFQILPNKFKKIRIENLCMYSFYVTYFFNKNTKLEIWIFDKAKTKNAITYDLTWLST